ncbi:helix-turn-helix domain-containing protein [Weeksellaceae bacterium A-14]
MKEQEEWKEYPIKRKFVGFYRIEVSNFGRMRTFNSMHPEGEIVEGSIIEGYRCLRAKLRKKRNDRDVEAIESVQREIDHCNEKIKELKNFKLHAEEVSALREERDRLVQKRKKINKKITNKNYINLSVVFHKAVAELFLDPPKNKKEKFVIHKDFDKMNNHVSNLQWASQEDLNARLKKHPKMILREFNRQFIETGPQVRSSKLTELEVLTIKKRLKRGYTLKKLARQFGVSDMQIHRIKTGENWSHVKLLEDIKENAKLEENK